MKAPDLSSVRMLVVGDVMLDRYWFGDVSRISPEAPVPVARITREETRAGGAANVARNAAAVGAKVDLLAVTGEDEAGRELERLLRDEGVAVAFTRDPTLKTTVKLRVIGRQQQLLRVDFENVPDERALASKLAGFDEKIGAADVVIFSDYGKGGLAHIEQMIMRARQHGKPVLVDPKGDDYERYRNATVLTPNRSEFREVVGRWKSEEDMAQRAQRLRESLGLQALLVTRSEEGMSLYEANAATHVPAIAQEVFDVSGAGDTVIAILGAMLASGSTLAQAVQWANKAGGIVVGKLGTAVVHPAELFG
ncbi:MAG: D-glycero-beta-D-manno-heptose-7-phosphate kinase [Betaproteobacteria bacterium]|nr:D-glycero-beta-D-manno-heptose-7-phosphate kinase [Betaproteobacteria bacterium]